MLIPFADMQMGMTDWHCFLFKIVGKAFYLKPSTTRNNIMTSNEIKSRSSDDVLMDAINSIHSEMNGLKSEMNGLKSEMNGLIHSEMNGLKSEMNGLKSEMNGLKSEMKSEKSEMNGLKSEMAGLTQQLTARLDANDAALAGLTLQMANCMDRLAEVEERCVWYRPRAEIQTSTDQSSDDE